MNVGEHVNKIIEANGLKKSALAKKLGKTPAALNNLLKQDNIGSKHLLEIAKALQMPLYILLMPLEEEEEEVNQILLEPRGEYGIPKDEIIKRLLKENRRLSNLVKALKAEIH